MPQQDVGVASDGKRQRGSYWEGEEEMPFSDAEVLLQA